MEKDKINLVYKFLDVTGEKFGDMYFALFVMEAFACLANYTNIGLGISVPCALVIFMSIVIWGDMIKENGEFFFIYLGVVGFLLSLCFMLIALGLSQFNLLYSFIVFIAMLLVSIPSGIYFVKRRAKKILSGQDSRDDTKLAPFIGVVGPLTVIIGIIETQILSGEVRTLIVIVCSYIMFCISLGCAIMDFYREIIRRRYNININNLLKQQTAKPTNRR
ncbi:membrane protein [Sporomusaceae bacterium BoRhaA]|uniref:hypothetical protein n=1 Tax=Pelorhabdus rhamnosifermentans TaxID=2772457 RepID=UPI001C0639D6|nr:hypothetical protein [Pelorhabdus rhamnosifermentans]MBU2703406.1 membrane protein [Pelorhabdus rhamnosifermentans]